MALTCRFRIPVSSYRGRSRRRRGMLGSGPASFARAYERRIFARADSHYRRRHWRNPRHCLCGVASTQTIKQA
uniref:Protein mu n=1 Tax=Human adenovirus F serotype 41 TaxID=10524 RepID=P87731_ADE41|nr:protein mu precursor [Human adenovirus 41]